MDKGATHITNVSVEQQCYFFSGAHLPHRTTLPGRYTRICCMRTPIATVHMKDV